MQPQSIDSELRSLKVPELKEICRQAQLSRQGLKKDLQDRLSTAFGGGPPSTCNAIVAGIQMLRPQSSLSCGTAFAATALHALSSSTPYSSSPVAYSAPLATTVTDLVNDTPGLPLPDSYRARCPCGLPQLTNFMVRCEGCGALLHGHCIGATPGEVHDGYMCATCSADQLDPFLVPASTASTIAVGLLRCNTQTLRVNWVLTPEQLGELHAATQLAVSAPHGAERSGLVVRCTSHLASTRLSGLKKHRWPVNSKVTVNTCDVPIVHTPPVWDGRCRKDRNLDEALIIPHHVLCSGWNEMLLQSDEHEAHVLVVQLLDCKSYADVRLQVVRDHTLPSERSREHLIESFKKMNGGGDADVVASAMRLTLQCPLTRSRMSTPVRTTNCRHIECFDLDAFLQCQRAARIPKWKCPLCSAIAHPCRLRVCTWLTQIIEATASTVPEVIIEADGSFSDAAKQVPPNRKRKASSACVADTSIVKSEDGDDPNNPIVLD